ncbi:MAG TPA: cytochrome c maturation protein CcmE [Gaiellaceae bacterium]
MKRSPARLVIALSVAAVLAVFILYTSIAGAGTPEIGPSTVGQHVGEDVLLVGTVVGHVGGNAHAGGMRFLLKDDHGAAVARTRVLYSGSVPDLFRTGRQIVVEGTLRNGTFVAKPGSLVTKCPSKYTPAKSNA